MSNVINVESGELTMWFSNAIFYRITRRIDLDKLEEKLSEFAFSQCGPNDVSKFGWVPALGHGSDLFAAHSNDAILINAMHEEKILPAAVVKKEHNRLIAVEELAIGKKVTSATKKTLKDDAVINLLKRAFTKTKSTKVLILPKENLIVVDAGSFKSSENVLALLRKSIGSLPVVPVVTEKPLALTLTEWVYSYQAPLGYSIGEALVLVGEKKEDGLVTYKDKDLNVEEVLSLIDNNMVVKSLSLSWQNSIEFIIADDFSMKRLKFSDATKDKNEDIGREDILARLDADLFVLVDEMRAFTNSLFEVLPLTNK